MASRSLPSTSSLRPFSVSWVMVDASNAVGLIGSPSGFEWMLKNECSP
jgi:hypothetical protein